MSVPRLLAVAFILVTAAAAWVVLGGSVESRTREADVSLHEQVSALWGRPQAQRAPRFTVPAGKQRSELQPSASDITAAFQLDQRRKGLLWYATYVVDFDAAYVLRNPDGAAPAEVLMHFPFPDREGVYDGFAVSSDGAQLPIRYADGSASARIGLPPGGERTVKVGYRTNGLDEWRYAPTDDIGVIEDFSLTVKTDFADIDFPDDSVSPTRKERTGNGWVLTWDYDSLVSGRPLALTMPKPLNPGPVASRISYFAPVSLLFYFAALLLLTAGGGLRVHPMNYAFLAGGFFAFHLLFAYLADQVHVAVAFGVASGASMALCVGYLAMVIGRRRALAETATAQFVFLVLFSFSFFFDGFTGLAVTIGSVLTLGFFMAKTGRLDWDEIFARSTRQAKTPAGPPPPPSESLLPAPPG
ncbi:MAG: inner membrane CreD family protein [Coriobacteriia bacterium]|nr:inner membrane CreD family protein [Coriobacteriia bacterium]